jgi:hypothetical protein
VNSILLNVHFFFPFAARIAEGAVFITGQLKDKSHLLGVARIMDYSCLFALLFSTLGFLGMAYVDFFFSSSLS